MQKIKHLIPTCLAGWCEQRQPGLEPLIFWHRDVTNGVVYTPRPPCPGEGTHLDMYKTSQSENHFSLSLLLIAPMIDDLAHHHHGSIIGTCVSIVIYTRPLLSYLSGASLFFFLNQRHLYFQV